MQLYLSKNMPKYMAKYVWHSCRILGLDKLRGDITVLLKGTLDGESFGLCWGDRREVEIHIATRQWGQPVSRENKLKTISHELTHAHQYLTGRLKCDMTETNFKSTWLGQEYSYAPEDEFRLPWEYEANEMEQIIYDKWIEYKYNRPPIGIVEDGAIGSGSRSHSTV